VVTINVLFYIYQGTDKVQILVNICTLINVSIHGEHNDTSSNSVAWCTHNFQLVKCGYLRSVQLVAVTCHTIKIIGLRVKDNDKSREDFKKRTMIGITTNLFTAAESLISWNQKLKATLRN